MAPTPRTFPPRIASDGYIGLYAYFLVHFAGSDLIVRTPQALGQEFTKPRIPAYSPVSGNPAQLRDTLPGIPPTVNTVLP